MIENTITCLGRKYGAHASATQILTAATDDTFMHKQKYRDGEAGAYLSYL